MVRKKEAGSPCVDVCAIDDMTGYCAGCFRTTEEIALWDRFGPHLRQSILANTRERQRTHVKDTGNQNCPSVVTDSLGT